MPYPHVNSSRITLRPLAQAPAVGFPLPHSVRPADASVTLGDWLDLWMDAEIEPRRAETTINGYWNIIRNHMLPALGAVRLADLSPDLINGYYKWLSTPPQATSASVQYYTPTHLGLLLREVEGLPLELPVKLVCHLGLRRSELLGLRWRDVDLQAGLLSVRRVRTTVGYRVVEKPPKTFDSCRTLSIRSLDGLLVLLRQIRAKRLRDDIPCSPDDYLVLNGAGEPWHPNVLSADLASFVEARRLPPITFHGLRHTFASMANSARVPMYQISRAMGHSSPNITQRIYTHLFDQTHGEVLAAVADVVKTGSASLPSA